MLEMTGITLTEKVVSKKCKEILDALYFFEQNGLTHGDLRTSNILLDADGSVKLSNYCISQQISEFKQIVKPKNHSNPQDVLENESGDYKIDN